MTLFVGERKTTSQDISFGSKYWTQLLLDPQISLYGKAATALGFDVRGVLYDVLRVPQVRPLKATPQESRKLTKGGKLYANQRAEDETPEEFGRRCLDAIVEDPDKFYKRATIVRLEHEYVEADLDVWHTAQNIRDSRRLRVFPRNPDSCQQYFRECDYFRICTGMASKNDPMLFRTEDRVHPELERDADADGLPLLTQSALRCYRACARRFQLRYEEKLRLIKPVDEPMRRGSSMHRALEAWSKTGHDLEAAIAVLDRVDPFSFQCERAMMIGYHARWEDKRYEYRWVEQEFRIPLTNPETGHTSRTFELAGKFDLLVDVPDDDDLSRGGDVAGKMLEMDLKRSVQDGGSEQDQQR
jgi:hypothetical protein